MQDVSLNKQKNPLIAMQEFLKLSQEKEWDINNLSRDICVQFVAACVAGMSLLTPLERKNVLISMESFNEEMGDLLFEDFQDYRAFLKQEYSHEA